MNTEKKTLLKRKLKELKAFSGSGTELISLYVSAGYPIHEVSGKLREELSQAGNIKSKQTRTHVSSALEKILQYLKVFKETPENGLVVFCGNTSTNPSKTEIELFSLEPPEPLQVNLYRCDSRFFLDPLEKMVEAKKVYGIVAMDGRDATLAILKGTYIEIVRKLHSTAHAKIKTGGQSAVRFERLINEAIEKYYKRIGEAMDQHFLGKIEGVIVGGPGPAKENFLKMSPFNYQIKILGKVDCGYSDEHGVDEIVGSAKEIITEQEAIKEKEIVENFIKEIARGGAVTYGEKEVRDAIESKRAKLVLISEGLKYKIVTYACGCGEKRELLEGIPNRCLHCNENIRVLSSKDLIDDMIELAERQNIRVEMISVDTNEGTQFLNGFGGLGAMLHF